MAIDRVTMTAFVQLHEKATRRVAGDFSARPGEGSALSHPLTRKKTRLIEGYNESLVSVEASSSGLVKPKAVGSSQRGDQFGLVDARQIIAQRTSVRL